MTTKAMRRRNSITGPSPSRSTSTGTSMRRQPAVLQLKAGAGQIDDVLLLQRLAGNGAVTTEVLRLPDVVGHATCDDLPELECSAKASRTSKKKIDVGAPAKKRDKEGNVTYHAKGTLTATFASTVNITLATPPDGLSPCATCKYQTLITKKLSPHEQDHKRRFLTADPKHAYNGTVKKSRTESGDDPGSVQASIDSHLSDAFDSEMADRQTRNDAHAIDAIDPFRVTADISSCPECKAAAADG